MKRSAYRIKLKACLLVLFAGCSDATVLEPDPEYGPMSGFWEGASADSVIVEVGIDYPGDGALAGCVRFGFAPLHRPDDRVTVAMAGSIEDVAVAMASPAGYAIAWHFDGTRLAEDVIHGSSIVDAQPSAILTLRRTASAPRCR